MAKLKPCKSCGEEISKNARSCPHCGQRFTSATANGCLWIIILTSLLIAYTLATRDEPTSTTIAEKTQPQEPAIVDDSKQEQRLKFIKKLMAQGIIGEIKQTYTSSLPKVYVKQNFYLLSFADKQKFMDVILSYHIIIDPKASIIVLKDNLTGKDIGTFSELGLDLD